MRIGVIGAGYLGAVHAVCMADLGHDVITYEIDPTKVDTLAHGKAPIYEPGLDHLLTRTLDTGRLAFTTDPAALAECRVVFVCVGTPQQKDSHAADTRFVHAAIDSVVPHLTGETLLVGKSTVPVGTAALLTAQAERLAHPDATVRLMWNPEFLREGFAIEDTLRPDRFVYGVQATATHGASEEHPDAAVLDEVYAAALATSTPRIVTDLATAELVKVAANAFLATKISFINAMSEVCEAAGADVVTLAKAIGHDDRIGAKFLGAGVGFGGGCLPKDIRAFAARAAEIGAGDAVAFLHQMDAINQRRRDHTVSLARAAVGDTFTGARVAVLGAAFKPNSDDIRDSPALAVAAACQREGATVVIHDPKAAQAVQAAYPALQCALTAAEAIHGADVVLHLTEWAEYRDLDPARLVSLPAAPVIIDGRNTLDQHRWQSAGWHYQALGRALAN